MVVINEQTTAAFITTWNTELGTSTIPNVVIPTNPEETYIYNVHWGDGTTDSNLSDTTTHFYEENGTYQIKITGLFPRFYFNLMFAASQLNLISIDQWGSGE